MTQTTYTVLRADGEINGRHLTATDAAVEIMTYDGYAYEIRRGDEKYDVADEARWELWTSDGSAYSTRSARHLSATVIAAYAADEQTAWPLIAAEVVKNAGWWHNQSVMTDADYDQMIADLASEEDAG